MPLHTIAGVKAFLMVTDIVTARDNFIASLILATDQKCKSYCKKDFELTTYTNQKLDGTGTNHLLLPQYPIDSISSIYDDINRDWGSNTLLSVDDYIYDSASGIITLTDGSVFTKGDKNIKITYSSGYTSIPDDLVLSCEMFTAYMYKQSDYGGSRFGKQSSNSLDGNINLYQKIIPDEIKDVWDLYKRQDTFYLWNILYQ